MICGCHILAKSTKWLESTTTLTYTPSDLQSRIEKYFGPLLFLIYVNDIPLSILHTSVLLFADDTKCYKHVNCLSDAALLQQARCTPTWSNDWKLVFNKLKCRLLRMSPSPISVEVEYNLGSTSIDVSSAQRDLGVILSSNIILSDHICDVTMKACKIVGLLQHICDSIHSNKLLYVSLVRSKLMFCSQVWHLYLKDMMMLETIQRRAKFILNDYTSDYKQRLIKLNSLSLMMIH